MNRKLKNIVFVWGLTGLLVTMGCNVFADTPFNPNFQTDFYRYYNPNTYFYMEVVPTKLLWQRIFLIANQLNPKHPEKIRAWKVFLNTYFEQRIAVGITSCKWVAVTDLNKKKPPVQPVLNTIGSDEISITGSEKIPLTKQTPFCDWIGVVQLKPGIDYRKLEHSQILSLKATPNAEKTKTAVQFDGTHLIISNLQANVKRAILQYKTGTSVADNPAFQSISDNLPADRNGLFLVSSDAATFMVQSNSFVTDPALSKKTALLLSSSDILPLFSSMIGSIVFQDDQGIQFKAVLPLDFSKIQNDATKKAYQAILKVSVSHDNLAHLLPDNQMMYLTIANLKGYFDFENTRISGKETPLTQLNSKTQHYFTQYGLDLQKNILDLFSNQFGLSVGYDKLIEPFVFLNHTDNTQHTFDLLFTQLKQRPNLNYEYKKVDARTQVQLLTIPQSPLSLAELNQNNQPLIVGTTDSINAVLAVIQKKQPALSDNVLYTTLTKNMPDQCMSFVYFDLHTLLQNVSNMSNLMSSNGVFIKKPPFLHANAKSPAFKVIQNNLEGFSIYNGYDNAKHALVNDLEIKLTPLQTK